MPSDSARFDEAMNVRPKGACKSMTGSVIDSRKKYPSTITFASEPSIVNAKLAARMTGERPGGSLRAGHGFKTIACHCSGHPCKCGTSEAHVIPNHTNGVK